MDQSSFDRIARLLGSAATRRVGLAAAAGILASGIAASASASAAGTRVRRRRPAPEGPCGDGSRKANLCDRNDECCTGVCELGKNPKKNAKDGRGRCRCIRWGRPCKQDRNCCNSFCIDGICGVLPPAALMAPCNSRKQQTCSPPTATCRAYQGTGAPAGDYCSLPLRSACTEDAECVSYVCHFPNNGAGGVDPETVCCGRPGTVCASDAECCAGATCAGGVCADETTCDVCAVGCPYTTIKDAVDNATAGAVIRVAPGTYSGDANTAIVATDLTIRRCGTFGSVIWQGATRGALKTPGSFDGAVPKVDFTLANLDFRGPANNTLIRVIDPPDAGGFNTMRLLGCTISGQNGEGGVDIDSADVISVRTRWFDNNFGSSSVAAVYYTAGASTSVFDRCEFRNNVATGSSGSSGLSLLNNTVTIRDSVFDGNGRCDGTSTSSGGAVKAGPGSTLTIERTRIVNNCGDSGGGIFFQGDGLTVDSESVITGNYCRAPYLGAGVYCELVDSNACAAAMTGVSSATVYGNDLTAGNCAVSAGIVSCDAW